MAIQNKNQPFGDILLYDFQDNVQQRQLIIQFTV